MIILLFICASLSAQDTIRFRNGDIRTGKVTEVTTKDIKYKHQEAPDEPPYVVKRENVFLVKYLNGEVDSFHVSGPGKVAAYSNPPDQKIISREGKIVIKKLDLIYQAEIVDDYRLLKLIEENKTGEKKNLLLAEYDKIKKYQGKQYLFNTAGFIGGPLIIVGSMIAGLSNLGNDPNGLTILVGFNLGVASMVTGGIMGKINKKKRLKQRVVVAQIYNDEYEFK